MMEEMALRQFYAATMDSLSRPDKPIKPRKGQYQLIRLGVNAEAGQRILAKAPTATGKSIAALMMGVVRAALGERTVIATGTKLLQNQYETDYRRVQPVFPDVEFCLLKGASNYLCRELARDNWKEPFGKTAKLVQDALWKIGAAPEIGDPGEIPYNMPWEIWHWCQADTLTCGKHDPSRCGYAAARARALVADVVIANHALVMVSGDFPDVFGPHSLLVVDEVHNFWKAAESYGSEIKQDQLLKELRSVGATGAIGPVTELFTRIAVKQMAGRYRYPVWSELSVLTEPYEQLVKVAKQDPLADEVLEPLISWVRLANQRIAEKSTAGLDRLPVIPKAGPTARQVYTLGLLPVDIAKVAKRGFKVDLPYENPVTERTEIKGRAIVMMSATIGTPSKPTFVADRCGVVPDRVVELESPLPYSEAIRASRIPKAAMAGVRWTEAVLRLVRQTRGRSLVLLSSWDRVMECESHLLDLDGINVYRQIRDDSRATAAEAAKFAADVNSVMVGTASLFEGVDFPGPTLTQVVLMDMVMVPDVMGERLRRLGRRWDDEFRVPYVGLLLEQIFGRLIRAPQDVGLLVCVDDGYWKPWGERAYFEGLSAFGGEVLDVPRMKALEWLRDKENGVKLAAV